MAAEYRDARLQTCDDDGAKMRRARGRTCVPRLRAMLLLLALLTALPVLLWSSDGREETAAAKAEHGEQLLRGRQQPTPTRLEDEMPPPAPPAVATAAASGKELKIYAPHTDGGRGGLGGDNADGGGAGAGGGGDEDDGEGSDEAGDDDTRDAADGSAAAGGGAAAAASQAEAHERGPSADGASANALKGPWKLDPLLPMLPALPATAIRSTRLLRYPLFNLTWTRGAPPPRSDGWSPSEGQRARLPTRDLKERYYRSCAVVGSSGLMRRTGWYRCWTTRSRAPEAPTTRSAHATQPPACPARPRVDRAASCASGRGKYIDAHELVMRFNGAPAGGGYGHDVGSRTTISVLADVATTECVDGKAKQPTLELRSAKIEGNLLQEPAPGWRAAHHCQYYPDATPPPFLFFLPRRGGVRRLVDYAVEHPEQETYIRSDALADEVDAQIAAYREDTSHPTSGFNGVVLALHICETVDLYGFGTPRDKYYSPPRAEKAGAQHLYRTEMRWLLGLEVRFPGRVRLWP